MNVTSYAEPGGHPRNEDAFQTRRIAAYPETWIIALSDGQGGRAGGARASCLACQTVIDLCSKVPFDGLVSAVTWEQILEDVDRVVCADSEAGFTTLVAFCVGPGRICGGSNGDSAVLLVDAERPGSILTSRQPKNPPVGSGEAAFAWFCEGLKAPWKALAMSDGVWKYATWQGTIDVLRTDSGESCIRALRDRAALRVSGRLQDDFTAVLIEEKGK